MHRRTFVAALAALIATPVLARGGNGGGGGGGSGGGHSGGSDPAGVYNVNNRQDRVAHAELTDDFFAARRRRRYRGRRDHRLSCDGGHDFPADNTFGGCHIVD